MTTATRPDVRIAERAGFCYGVRLAIDKAKHAREEGKEVTTLGQLVHNPGIKADLSDRGIRTADLADQVEGGTLVIRAHGVPRSEFEQVRGKESLEVIDATCTWVLQSQKAARELAEAGYTVRSSATRTTQRSRASAAMPATSTSSLTTWTDRPGIASRARRRSASCRRAPSCRTSWRSSPPSACADATTSAS